MSGIERPHEAATNSSSPATWTTPAGSSSATTGAPPAPAVSANSRHDAASAPPDEHARRAPRPAATSMPRLTRTWNAAMASELTTTITAEIERGASVCSATHSGSPLESIAQHSASTPDQRRERQVRAVVHHAQPAAPCRARGAGGARHARPRATRVGEERRAALSTSSAT